MVPLRRLRDDITGSEYRLAVLLGAASIPVTVWVNWALVPGALPRSSEIWPVTVACLAAGYCYAPRAAASGRAGAITALVGGAPVVLWQAVAGFGDAWNSGIVGGQAPRAVLAAGIAVVTVSGLALLLWVVGTLCGGLGARLRGRLDASRSSGSTG
jgi:hypothetical protein